jgi:hypothetical protein
MKACVNSVFTSCILQTIALLFFVRAALWNYSAGSNKASLVQMNEGFRAQTQTLHYLGVACLAIILSGLIVLWSGYIVRRRSAWLVMFVIVWLWAFPLFILPFVSPLLHGKLELTFPEFLYNAISAAGLPREVLGSILMFSAMLIGLFLPIKKFFGTGEDEESTRRFSARQVSFLVSGILVVLIALYAWIRVGVVYEIPVTQLSSTHRLPPPPPPHVGD